LLVAALAPPVRRCLVVARAEIDVICGGRTFALATNRWAGGAVAPEGYRRCESFEVRDGLPAWTYACDDALLEQTIAMPDGADATALALRAVRAREPLQVRIRLLAADRDHHGGAPPAPDAFRTTLADDAATIALPASARDLYVFAPGATFEPAATTYHGFHLAREAERGLPATAAYVHVLTIAFVLEPGDAGGLVLSLDAGVARFAPALVDARRERNRARAASQPTALRGELALAADAFIVQRTLGGVTGHTVIAGYPWFEDWGRHAMIALPGLTLATGRADVACSILRTFARAVDGGMLPNRFPDDGSAPDYNTVDAALWFIEAVRATFAVTGDITLLRDVFPACCAIIDGYVAGTRYGIRVDADGLVRCGEPGVQLTWMDAKVDGRVNTPRIGKPVEINALWYAALRAMDALSAQLDRPAGTYAPLAERCAASFVRFRNAARGDAYDVIDGPDGDDASLRPNQLFALALHASPVTDERWARTIVDTCARDLLTSYGLRTLAPGDPRYRGRYAGDRVARDEAYHQGTVWPWLMGAFVRAHLRVYRDPGRARTFIEPLIDALGAQALGTLGEIGDGDAPFTPRGAVAQAWSVGELTGLLAALDPGPGNGPR